jgi:hypothetical protein
MEVGPVGGWAMSEVVEPQRENLFLLFLFQQLYGLLQHTLQLSSFSDAQDWYIRAIACSTKQWQPRNQHLNLCVLLLLLAFFSFVHSYIFGLLEEECCN